MYLSFFTLAHLAVLTRALVGGVFLAFSDSIMRAYSVSNGQERTKSPTERTTKARTRAGAGQNR